MGWGREAVTYLEYTADRDLHDSSGNHALPDGGTEAKRENDLKRMREHVARHLFLEKFYLETVDRKSRPLRMVKENDDGVRGGGSSGPGSGGGGGPEVE